MRNPAPLAQAPNSVRIPSGTLRLEGDLQVPHGAHGLVLFAHGSGSSRRSTRNRYVAEVLHSAGLGTLLFDLLTEEEGIVDRRTGHLRFDVALLARRLTDAAEWAEREPALAELRLGLFGASTGAAAALVCASMLADRVGAVVSRGGRPDLAGDALPRVRAPTLLIVGGRDQPVLALNQMAYEPLVCEKHLRVVPGATHLFEEEGTLETAADLASAWFEKHLAPEERGAA